VFYVDVRLINVYPVVDTIDVCCLANWDAVSWLLLKC